MISAIHAVPRNDVILGIVRAADIDVSVHPEGFQLRLDGLLERRRHDLDHDEESRRTAVRDILRNGVYKPTGRGKPASEYLLRAASQPDGSFPTINAPVDVCNYVSLKHILPISLWDVDRSGSSHFVFRLGAPGERYIFNETGQEIDLEDLLVGCRVREENHSPGEPIVNPVKDSLATKTTPESLRVGACVYAPLSAVSVTELEGICGEFADLLSGCGMDPDVSFAVLRSDSSVDV